MKREKVVKNTCSFVRVDSVGNFIFRIHVVKMYVVRARLHGSGQIFQRTIIFTCANRLH